MQTFSLIAAIIILSVWLKYERTYRKGIEKDLERARGEAKKYFNYWLNSLRIIFKSE